MKALMCWVKNVKVRMQKMDSLRAALAASLDASTYDDMMFCHHEIVHAFEAFHHERLLFPDGENSSQILVFF